MSIPKPKIVKTEKSFRKLSEVEIDKFVEDMHIEELNDNHLDKQIDHWNRNVTKSQDIHAPLKTVKIKNKEYQPWYTNELAEWKQVRRVENSWLKYHEEHQWKAYKVEGNYYNFKLKCAKTEFMIAFWTANRILKKYTG